MSQKTNSLSTKLGILQIWTTTFPKYGSNFKYYSRILHVYLNIITYLSHFLKKYGVFRGEVSIYLLKNNPFVNIIVFLNDTKVELLKDKILVKVISYWIKTPVIVHFYKKNNFMSSSFLLMNYITFLINKGLSSRKVIQNTYKILQEQSIKFKLVQTCQGIKKVQLKGFKIKFSGCFESSRTQIAKVLNYNFGSLSLTNLNGYTEYSYNVIHTKLGSCGLKIWLFYEFKSL